MFTDQDVSYHTPDDAAYSWGETSFFYFQVPEANIMGLVYVVARAGVGSMVAEVEIWGDLSLDPIRAWYVDVQQSLPLPAKFEDFSLPNGLTYLARGIRDYRIDYIGVNETELHLDIRGTMDPYDIHDPAMDPLAQPHAPATSSGVGQMYSAHFDMSTHVTGTMRVRGRDYVIDCFSTMDHSWGPRAERGGRSMAWINANFGRDYALHGIWTFNPEAAPDDQFRLTHGYALVDGKVRGATGGQLRSHRFGRLSVGYEMTITDVDGREHHLFGSPTAAHQLHPYGCVIVPTTMVRWQQNDRIGWGQSQEVYILDRYAGAHLDGSRYIA